MAYDEASGTTVNLILDYDEFKSEIEKTIEEFIEWFDKNYRLGKEYLIADKANKELLIW